MSMEYDSDSILVLDGIEAVRKRPGMYIGDVSHKGLHQLFFEVVENSIDEVLAGYCQNIWITLKEDSVTIKDDGRGIPVNRKEEFGQSALEVVMTRLHAGGKFNDNVYAIAGGLHGVGLSCVNALSEWLLAKIKRNNKIYEMRFEFGRSVTPLKELGETDESGTEISFKPDSSIMEETKFDPSYIKRRLRQLAFLNNGVKIYFNEINGKEEVFHYTDGLTAYLSYLNENKKPLHDPISIRKEEALEGQRFVISVEIGIQYTDSYAETLYSFANNVYTSEGGTHLTGFRYGLTRAVNYYAKTKKDNKYTFSGEDVREGGTAIVNVRLPNPVFEGQTKNKLMNSDVKNIVEQTTYEGMERFLEENPQVADRIIRKIESARKARDAAQKSRELVRKKNTFGSVLPGKLADCSGRGVKKEEREIFIVEGDSAGGSAKQARDRKFQAILPLRGKIINVEKNRIDKILKNEEIQSLISASGCGIGEDLDMSKLRYGKIIITTDADVDGAHIRTLLLTFFFRYMSPLIEGGKIYSAMPPLYKISKGKKEHYAYTDEELRRVVDNWGGNVSVQRYKGLGEMNPEQLWDTTMDPKSRTLIRITMEDAEEADRVFTMLMGENVGPRRNFIQENADKVNLDV